MADLICHKENDTLSADITFLPRVHCEDAVTLQHFISKASPPP